MLILLQLSQDIILVCLLCKLVSFLNKRRGLFYISRTETGMFYTLCINLLNWIVNTKRKGRKERSEKEEREGGRKEMIGCFVSNVIIPLSLKKANLTVSLLFYGIIIVSRSQKPFVLEKCNVSNIWTEYTFWKSYILPTLNFTCIGIGEIFICDFMKPTKD